MTEKNCVDLPDVVYTDGCCTDNGRKGAQAGIGVYWGPNHPCNISEKLDGKQTNNRAEITAAIRAIEQALDAGKTKLTICTDSHFMIDCMTKWMVKWKKNNWKLVNGEPVKNQEDLKRLDDLCNSVNITWRHVRGHQGIEGNEMADKLAKDGSLKLTTNSSDMKNNDSKVSLKRKSDTSDNEITEKRRELDENHEDEETKSHNSSTYENSSSPTDDTLPDVAFVYGCSFYNGKDNAVAGAGVYWGENSKFNLSEKLNGKHTSNSAQILAACLALQQAISYKKESVVVCTESEFLINCITKWIENWKKKGWKNSSGEMVKNKEELSNLDSLCQQIKVTWKCVKGEKENKAASNLAKAGGKTKSDAKNKKGETKSEEKMESSEESADLSSARATQEAADTVYVCGVLKPRKEGNLFCWGVYWGEDDPRNTCKILDGDKPTSKRAELNACISAIEQALDSPMEHLKICCSDEYVFNCMSKWIKQWAVKEWRTSSGETVKNKEELVKLNELCTKIDVEWVHESNKECRKLAFKAK